MRWVREGTVAIVAGDGDNATFRALAVRVGMSVTQTPIGSVSAERFTTLSAWSVASCPVGASEVRAKQFVIGCVTHLGSGLLISLADGGFFLSKNLEMEDTYDEKNMSFLDSLLRGESAF